MATAGMRFVPTPEAAHGIPAAGPAAAAYPAAASPLHVLRRGGSPIELNPNGSEPTPLATLSLRGPAAALLERLLQHVDAGSVEVAS